MDAFKADHPNHRQGGALKFPLEFSFLSGEVGAGEFLVGQRCARRVQFLLRKAKEKLSRASMCMPGLSVKARRASTKACLDRARLSGEHTSMFEFFS